MNIAELISYTYPGLINTKLIIFFYSGKFFDTSFGMGYLMSPYAAAYANGLTNGSHMVSTNDKL